MNSSDVRTNPIVPSTPKIKDVEKVMVYTPIAGYRVPGISSFDRVHFDVVNGHVKIRNRIDKAITSIDINAKTGEATVIFSDGVIKTFTLPALVDISDYNYDTITVLSFTEDTWYEKEDLLNDTINCIDFSKEDIMQPGTEYISYVEKLNELGEYENVSITVKKDEDGLHLQSSFTFDGRVLLFNNKAIDLKKFKDTQMAALDKALSNALNSLEDSFKSYDSKLKDAVDSIKIQSEMININANRVDVLYDVLSDKRLISSRFANRNTELDVTGGILSGLSILDNSYATVNKISGNTINCENLINVDAMVADEGATDYYSSLSKNSDGSFTMTNKEGANSSKKWNVNLKAGTYTASYRFLETNMTTVSNSNRYSLVVTYTLQEGGTKQTIISFGSTPVKGKVCKGSITLEKDVSAIQLHIMNDVGTGVYVKFDSLMLNKGSTALPYQPYFTGLKNAQISGIKSIGRNLFNIDMLDGYIQKDILDSNFFTFTTNPSDIPAKNKTITFDKPTNVYSKISYKAYDTSRPSSWRGIVVAFEKADGTTEEMATFVALSGTSSISVDNVVKVYFTFGSERRNTVGNFIVSLVDTDYEPYTESVMQLPETVELGIWDYIENGQIVRQTSEEEYTITGDNDWQYSEQYKQYYVNVNDAFGILVLDVVTTSTLKTSWSGGSASGGYGLIVIYESQNPNLPFSNIDECKTYFNANPLTFKHKTVTPTYEPITFNNQYQVWDKGMEQIITPEEDGRNCFDYRANPTVTAKYYVEVKGE